MKASKKTVAYPTLLYIYILYIYIITDEDDEGDEEDRNPGVHTARRVDVERPII